MPDFDLLALLHAQRRLTISLKPEVAAERRRLAAQLSALPDQLAAYPAEAVGELSEHVQLLATQELPAYEAQLRLRYLLEATLERLQPPRG